MKKIPHRSDLRTLHSPLHQGASWGSHRESASELARLRACRRSSQQAAITRSLPALAADIFAHLLPSFSLIQKQHK